MKSRITKYCLWALIAGLVGVGLWLRFWHLDVVPAAFYHDELDYVVTGESILLWGTDLSGTWKPWQLRPLQTINFTAELPGLFHALTQLLFGSTPQFARLTNAIWGLATVILTGFLALIVSGRKNVGMWTAGLMLVNHWHVHISRLGYEATISLFFQVLVIMGLIKILPPNLPNKPHPIKGRWLAITLLAIFLSYYTYHGSKFTITVVVGSYLGYWLIKAMSVKRKIPISWFAIGILMVALVGQSLRINHLGMFGYRNNLSLYLGGEQANVKPVNNIDRISFLPRPILDNKYTQIAQELINRYWFVFDPNRLFFSGYEGGHQFSLIISGYFGVLELLGIILFWRLVDKNKYVGILLCLLLISPLATLMAGYQSILRSALTYTLLLILAGWGIDLGLEKIGSRWSMVIVIWLMVILSAWFGLQYFSRYPLAAAENHLFSDRILSRYLKSVDREVMVVVDKDTYITARNIAYYNQLIPELSDAERAQFAFPFPATIRIKNITVTTECPKNLTDELLVVHPNKWQTCGLKDIYQTIDDKPQITVLPSPLDNGSYYFIWHNVVCQDKGNQFIHLQQLSELNMEKLTDAQFCQTWIRCEQ